MRRGAGFAAMAGAFMAIAGNAAVTLAHPSVPKAQTSYPLSAAVFSLGQVWFAMTQALMAVGILGLVRRSSAATGRRAATFGAVAVAGMIITVPGELALIAVAAKDVDSAATSAVSSVFGIGTLLADIGLIGFGLSALRQRRWMLPARVLPLTFGVFQLLIVTPVSLSLGFSSAASFVAIAVADLLMAGIGW